MQNSFVFPHGEMVLDYYYHHHHFHTYHLQNHHLTVKASSFSDFTHCGNNNNNKNINNNNNSKEGNKYNNNNKSYIKYSNNNNNSFCKIVKNNVNNTSKTLNKHLNSNLATFLANSNPNIIYNENKNNNKNNNYNETNNSNTNNMVNKNTILKAPKIVISSSSYQNNNYSDNNISKNININTNTNRYHHRNHHLLRHHHHHLVSSLERGRCRKKDLTYIVLETSINNDNEKNDNKNNSIDNINKKSNNNSNTNNNNNKDNNDCLNTLTCSFFCGNRNKNNVKSLQNDAKAEICIKATPYNNNNNNNEKIHNKNINTKEIEESKGNTITKELKAISPDKLASLIIDQGATTWANDNLSNGVSKITLHDVTEEGSPEKETSIKGQQEKSIQHYQFSQLNQQHSIKSNTQQNSLPPTPPNPKQAPPSPHHILLDCRTFFHYNTNHIVSSFNLSCSDCITRKRLKNGKIDVIDLISGPKDAKSIFKRIFSRHNHQPMIVLYDNDTDDVSEVNPNHPFVLVFNSLRKLTPNVLYLAGGIKHFQQKHQHLCVHNLSHPSDPIQLSSSSSSSTNDIDNATISILLPFLYIGNEQDSLNQALLQKEGITHILNVTRHIQMPIQHLTYLRLPALDNGGQNLKQYFEMAYKFIEDARMKGGKVLVHCQAGVSRSASIAMSYLMQKYRMPMMQAFKWVKSIRPIVAPNFNFLGQLLELEGKLGYTPIPNSSSFFSSSSYSSSSSSGVSSSGVSSSSSQNKLWHDVFRDLNVNDDDDDDDDEDDEGFVNGSSSCGGDDDSKSSLKVLGDNNKNNNKKKNNNFNTNRKNTR